MPDVATSSLPGLTLGLTRQCIVWNGLTGDVTLDEIVTAKPKHEPLTGVC